MGLFKRHAALLAVLAVIFFTAAIRLRVADVPLERDEGEYAYAGQLILQGIPPYGLAYNMKFPGTYYAYGAILALIGQSPRDIHVGLLLVNAATTLVLFFLGRRVLGSASAAAVSAAAFAMLSLDRWTNGVFAHATAFVMLPALGGLLLLRRALDEDRRNLLVLSGMLLGVATLMKQPGFFFLPLAMVLLLRHDRQRLPRHVPRALLRQAWLLGGAALPFAILIVVLGAEGVLGKAWFWTVQYARAYASEGTLSDASSMLVFAWTYISRANLPMWWLAAGGLAALWLLRWPSDGRVWVSAVTVASAIAVCPGFYFRPHYFLLLLPAAGLLVGVAIGSAERLIALALPPRPARGLALAILIAAAGSYVVREHRYLFSMSPVELSRELYATNPFIEAPDIARYIREHTSTDDRIAVLGSEPEIYFYAQRISATGYLYTYPLFEPQPYAAKMEEELMHEIEAAQPRYLVYALVGSSWFARENPPVDRPIMSWARSYARTCYDVVGVADIDMAHTTFVWDEPAAAYQPRGTNVMYTLRRKVSGPCTVAR
jgi:hypothetical protein